MTKEQLKETTKDIGLYGLSDKVAFRNDPSGREILIDGRSRLDALEALHIEFFTNDGKLNRQYAEPRDDIPEADVPAWIMSKNVHRRHLTTEQKREVIECYDRSLS